VGALACQAQHEQVDRALAIGAVAGPPAEIDAPRIAPGAFENRRADAAVMQQHFGALQGI
jgi:hypothetical protein